MILRSVHLRADFGLRAMDALHLATALVHGCDTFVTNDRRIARVDRIRVPTLDDSARRKSGNPLGATMMFEILCVVAQAHAARAQGLVQERQRTMERDFVEHDVPGQS